MIVLGSSGVDGHVMGIYFFSKATKGASIDKLKLSPPVTPMGDDAQSLMSARSK